MLQEVSEVVRAPDQLSIWALDRDRGSRHRIWIRSKTIKRLSLAKKIARSTVWHHLKIRSLRLGKARLYLCYHLCRRIGTVSIETCKALRSKLKTRSFIPRRRNYSLVVARSKEFTKECECSHEKSRKKVSMSDLIQGSIAIKAWKIIQRGTR